MKPQTIYVKQDSDNKKALRVRKVVRDQAMTTKAEKVSEAIQAEGNEDPKIVKILVKDAVDENYKEVAEKKKQQDANSEKRKANKNKSQHFGSKQMGGAQQSGSGGASSKKKSLTRASGHPAGGSESAANAGKKGRQPSSGRKSQKSGTRSPTKSNKTSGRSKKKVKLTYGFVPNLSLSICKNTAIVIGNLLVGTPFQDPKIKPSST